MKASSLDTQEELMVWSSVPAQAGQQEACPVTRGQPDSLWFYSGLQLGRWVSPHEKGQSDLLSLPIHPKTLPDTHTQRTVFDQMSEHPGAQSN